MKRQRTRLVNPCHVDPTARAQIDGLVNEESRSQSRKVKIVWAVVLLLSILAVALSNRESISEGLKITLAIFGWGGIIAFAAYLSTFRPFRNIYNGPWPW